VCEALESGVARHVTDLVTHARNVHHIVAVPPRRVGGVTDTTAVPAMQAAGADVHVIDMRRNPIHPANARATLALRQLQRRLRPDVVHGHSSIGGALARATPARRTARVWTPNGVMTAAPVLAMERAFGLRTDRVVAVSESEAQLLVAHRVVPRNKIVVIPNGISVAEPGPAPMDVRQHLGLDSDTPLVGAIGRIAAQKAPLTFVDACRIVAQSRADVHFVQVGDGPLAGDVDRAVQEWDRRGQFHRLGPQDNAASLLPQLSVLVQISMYEGGPYVPLEAMRARIPVVLSDVVGNRDTIVDGVSGLLVPVSAPSDTAAAVLRLLADTAAADEIAAAGRRRFEECFDVEIMARAHEAMYADAVAQRTTTR
jgi:glycosyltransferase involved in cell wall biosynthesis